MSGNDTCQVDPLEKPLDRDALSTAMVAFLAVEGMGCPRCAMCVRNGLLDIDGVLLVEVQLEQGFAAAAFDPKRITYSDLVSAVVGAGYGGLHQYRAEFINQVPVEGG